MANRDPITFKSYAILGDDICIWDDVVARKYQMIMSWLGVEITLSKSHVSSRCAEFAKSLFVEGDNVSPLPLELIDLRIEYYYQDSVLLLEELMFRGIEPTFYQYTTACLHQKPYGIHPDRLAAILTCPYIRCSWSHVVPAFVG